MPISHMKNSLEDKSVISFFTCEWTPLSCLSSHPDVSSIPLKPQYAPYSVAKIGMKCAVMCYIKMKLFRIFLIMFFKQTNRRDEL